MKKITKSTSFFHVYNILVEFLLTPNLLLITIHLSYGVIITGGHMFQNYVGSYHFFQFNSFGKYWRQSNLCLSLYVIYSLDEYIFIWLLEIDK